MQKVSGTLVDRIKDTKLIGDQKIIAAYLTQDLHEKAFLSSAEIAAGCGVSASAVTRLAQKLGYEGFPELKKDLEALYRKRISPLEVFETFVKKTGEQSPLAVTLLQDMENLQKLQSQTMSESLDQIVKLITRSEKVYLVGIGMAEILVDTLASFLDVLGKSTVKLKSFGVSKQAELIEFSRHDLVIGFSFQRILKEVYDVAQLAKADGARTLAITDSETNALALACDKTLLAPVIGSAFGMSLIAPLSLVNAIGNTLAASDQVRNQKRLEGVKKSWEKSPIFCE